jgi:hypothetical protein
MGEIDRMRKSGYDIIGDVHGQAGALLQLLTRMGYRPEEVSGRSTYRHPERKAVFVGDLIDRGPQIPATVRIVRAMVEAGEALCVLGNHEWNALGWSVEHPGAAGTHLREHSHGHWRQHRETVRQFPPTELARHLAWFRTLPFALTLNGLRIVHSCWDPRALAVIESARQRHGGLTDAFLVEGFDRSSPLFAAVERVLKGPEMKLPEGVRYFDKEGTSRDAVRIRWFEEAAGRTLRSFALPSGESIPELPLAGGAAEVACPYPPQAPLLFLGHYWLDPVHPVPLAPNVVCLDYSVAKQGFLCGYRFDGESAADPSRFVIAWPDPATGFAA